MATTTIHGWKTPNGGEIPAVPADMKALADQLDTQVPFVCTAATRPQPFAGLQIYETDTKRWYYGDGADWHILAQDWVGFTPTWMNFENLGSGYKSWGQYSIAPGGMVTLQMKLVSGAGSLMGPGRLTVANFPLAAAGINLQMFGTCSFLHTGPNGLLRTGILAMGGTGTSAEIFVPQGATPVATPGNTGIPWQGGSELHAHVTYPSILAKTAPQP